MFMCYKQLHHCMAAMASIFAIFDIIYDIYILGSVFQMQEMDWNEATDVLGFIIQIVSLIYYFGSVYVLFQSYKRVIILSYDFPIF